MQRLQCWEHSWRTQLPPRSTGSVSKRSVWALPLCCPLLLITATHRLAGWLAAADDTKKVQALLESKGKLTEPEFFPDPSCPFYSYPVGTLSPYGVCLGSGTGCVRRAMMRKTNPE